MTFFAVFPSYNIARRGERMKQVIYLDVLIFLNTVITFLLLLTSSHLMKIYPTAGRFTLASILGGLSSLIIIAPDLGLPLSLLTRLLFSLIIVVAAYNPKSIPAIAKETGYFFTVNFIFAGIMLFASSLPGISLISYNNGAVYINFSFFSLVGACVICYAVVCILGKITKNKLADTVICNIEITHCGKSVNTSAIIDTGNALTDPFTGHKVIVADRFVLSDILPENIGNYLNGNPDESGIKLIPCNTVSGSSLLPCFKADRIKVSANNRSYELHNTQIAVSSRNLPDVILPSDERSRQLVGSAK